MLGLCQPTSRQQRLLLLRGSESMKRSGVLRDLS